MKILLFISAMLISTFSIALEKQKSHVYIIFYATCKGKTGHMGIAVDNYKIIFNGEVPDTVTTGELTYYDLWPNEDHFNVRRTGKDIPGEYYKLPVSSFNAITLNSLYDKGLPHKENYPCDGLLQISTTWEQGNWMISFLDSMVQANRLFNSRRFNCSDFVRVPLERLLNRKLKSKEFFITGWSTTPNKLYRNLRKIDKVEVLKSGDNKASGTFIGQRVIFKLFHNEKNI